VMISIRCLIVSSHQIKIKHYTREGFVIGGLSNVTQLLARWLSFGETVWLPCIIVVVVVGWEEAADPWTSAYIPDG
jgi:hypothetical protein